MEYETVCTEGPPITTLSSSEGSSHQHRQYQRANSPGSHHTEPQGVSRAGSGVAQLVGAAADEPEVGDVLAAVHDPIRLAYLK